MSDWAYHGRTTNVKPRNAFEALVKIGQLVDEGSEKTADVQLGEIYSAIKHGANADITDRITKRLENDEKFKQLVDEYEEKHIHFLVDKGHIFDRGKKDETRELALSNQGRSIVDYDRAGQNGKARRLFIEGLESTQANTFRYGAKTQNDTKEGIRPLAHLAQTLLNSEQDKLDQFQAAEAVFASTDPEKCADCLDETARTDKDERVEKIDSHQRQGDAEALFKEAVNHPAFYWKGSGKKRTLHVRDKTALKQLADQHDGITPDQYRTMDREVGRLIQGQPGLRMADLCSIKGVGPKTERAFYQELSERCSGIEADDPDVRRKQVGQAIDETISEQLPSNVDAEAVRDALNIQDHDYKKLYRGELQSMRQAVKYTLEETGADAREVNEIVSAVIDGEHPLIQENETYLCGIGPMREPSSGYRDGYEALLACEGFSRRLSHTRAREGMYDDQIKRMLRKLNAHYTDSEGVENALRHDDDIRNVLADRDKALELEDFFGLSLMAMADDDQDVTRNLKTAWKPYGEHGSSFAAGDEPDVSVLLGERDQHFTGEVTGISQVRDLFKKEVEPILEHAKKYAEEHDLDPENVPVLFVAPAGLDSESRVVEGLINAYSSSGENFNTNPVPIDLEMYISIFDGVQTNDTSLGELYDFLQTLGKTFEMYVRYGFPVEDWARQARQHIAEHVQEKGELGTDDAWEVKLPISRHGDHETKYCTAQSNELSELTYEKMLELYDNELDADLTYYREQADDAEGALRKVAVSLMENNDMFNRFDGDPVLTPPGFRYLLHEHGDIVLETVRDRAQRNQNQNKGSAEVKKEDKEARMLQQAEETIEAVLSSFSRDELEFDDLDFYTDLLFWNETINRYREDKASFNDIEQAIMKALGDKDGFAEWASELETTEQKQAALHVLFAENSVKVLKEKIEGNELDMVEQLLQSDTLINYSEMRKQLDIPKRATYKKWREINYWQRNFPQLFNDHIKPMLDGGTEGYKKFLWDMSEVLKKEIEASIKDELEGLIERYDGDREAVYNELKKQFEDEQLQQLAQQAKAVLNRPIELNSDDDRDFKNKLEDVVSIMASEAERSFKLEELDTNELRSYYEQLREEFEKSTETVRQAE